MRYGLKREVLGSYAFTPLSEDAYKALLRSTHNLRLMLFIEEQLDLVMGNYIEFETDLLSMSLRFAIGLPDYETMQRERSIIINRRFTNLINACRGYLDHTRHHLRGLQGLGELTTSFFDEFEQCTNSEYDQFLGYRVMEAMRNYTQHAGFPIAFTYYEERVGEGDACKWIIHTRPFIDVRMLGKSFKSSVRQEIEGLGDEANVMPLVRQYIASIGSVHDKIIRHTLRPSVAEWEKTIFEAIELFRSDHPRERIIGLTAVKLADNGGLPDEKTPFYDKPIEYRRTLERKNRLLATLARRYVTNESF